MGTLAVKVLLGATIAAVAFQNAGLGIPRSIPVLAVHPDKVPHVVAMPLDVAVDVTPHVTVLYKDVIKGSETVAFDAEGRLYIPDEHGRIYRTTGDNGLEEIAYVGGRPLGCLVDPEGNLLLALCDRGFVSVGKEAWSKPAVLAARVSPKSKVEPGTPIMFADGIELAADGTMYWTDATDIPATMPVGRGQPWDALAPWQLTLFSGRATGRLMEYRPDTGETHVLASGLWFANGVALSRDESFLVVSETNTCRMYRYWLKGSKAGTMEVFASLPAFPDGVSRASDGNFWVGAPGVPKHLWMPTLLAKVRSLRVLAGLIYSHLPPEMGFAMIKKNTEPQGLVLKVSAKDGSILKVLRDPKGAVFHEVTSAVEQQGKLYLGSLALPGVPVIDLRAAGLQL